jgi:hypothetical protein
MPRHPAKPHPHAGATYRVINFDAGMLGVEITIPEMLPATVGKFATQADAQTWIASHRNRVQAETETGQWFGGRARQRAQKARSSRALSKDGR